MVGRLHTLTKAADVTNFLLLLKKQMPGNISSDAEYGGTPHLTMTLTIP